MSQLQLKNNKYCPVFCKLPLEHAIDSDFHDVCLHPFLRPTVRPSHHWVFLGEIFTDMSLFRPSYAVKDRAGDQLPVYFHHDDPMEELVYEFDAARYVVGSTIAMFYAENHAFMDGTHGIRVESLASIKLIPCSLEALLSADPAAVDAQAGCAVCRKKNSEEADITMLRCSACKTKYCSKKCQKKDWKAHKSHCVALRQVRLWNTRNWDQFTGFWEAF